MLSFMAYPKGPGYSLYLFIFFTKIKKDAAAILYAAVNIV